jgi:peptidoglycan/xylan/chitin deacetylase (PgdA/CDA1 family)
VAAACAAGLGVALAGGSDPGPSRATGARSSTPAPASAAAARLAEAALQQAELRRLMAVGRPIFCAGTHGRDVALTFDDGPGPYTRLVLAKLRKHHVHATFFVVGRNLHLVPGALPAERAVGAVGDHTWTHPLLTALAPAEVQSQLARTKAAAERASGGPVQLFRPPYGAHDAVVDTLARRDGLLEILWSVDSADSLGANYRQIEHNVISNLHPGTIVLMHENHGQTVRALLGIFAALQRRHLTPVSIPQLLAADPPSAAQLRAGRAGCPSVGRALTNGA